MNKELQEIINDGIWYEFHRRGLRRIECRMETPYYLAGCYKVRGTQIRMYGRFAVGIAKCSWWDLIMGRWDKWTGRKIAFNRALRGLRRKLNGGMINHKFIK